MQTTMRTPYEAYALDAVIYDRAPPLGRRGMHRASVTAWLAGWEGPMQIEARDVNLIVDGRLAFGGSNYMQPERRSTHGNHHHKH